MRFGVLFHDNLCFLDMFISFHFLSLPFFLFSDFSVRKSKALGSLLSVSVVYSEASKGAEGVEKA